MLIIQLGGGDFQNEGKSFFSGISIIFGKFWQIVLLLLPLVFLFSALLSLFSSFNHLTGDFGVVSRRLLGFFLLDGYAVDASTKRSLLTV